MSLETVQIYVVATRKRPAIIVEALSAQNIPHHVCWTTDYKLEPDWKPEPQYGSLVHNQVGAMRCYRGHQDALRFFRDETPDVSMALVLEDDAWPNREDWTSVVISGVSIMNRYELVSLHGRAFRHEDFSVTNLPGGVNELMPLAQGQVWVQGSLAYLIHRNVVNKFIDAPYVGYPSDLFICNRFNFGLVDPSPFDHNRKHGSLIDCATPKD